MKPESEIEWAAMVHQQRIIEAAQKVADAMREVDAIHAKMKAGEMVRSTDEFVSESNLGNALANLKALLPAKPLAITQACRAALEAQG